MKKFFYCIFLILNIFCIAGCESSKTKDNMVSFRIDEATDYGKDYIKNLAEDESNNIQSYLLKEVAEGSDYVVLTYRVVRGNAKNINIDLDEFKLRINENDSGYYLSQLKSDNISQMYINKKSLRMINQDTGLSQLLIRLKDMPKEVYPQNSDIMLNKESVNNEDYEKLAIDTNGKKVGTITKSNNKYFISLIQAEDSKQTAGEADSTADEGDSGESNTEGIDTLEEMMEVPIASQITAYDLISSNKIEKFIFSSDGNYLLLQSNDDGKGRLYIYKNPDGEKVDLNLDKVFPKDKFSINIKLVNDNGVFITANDGESEKIYRIDLKNKKIFNEDKEK